MYKQDLALNNLQWLICHQTKPNQTKFIIQRFMKSVNLNIQSGPTF